MVTGHTKFDQEVPSLTPASGWTCARASGSGAGSTAVSRRQHPRGRGRVDPGRLGGGAPRRSPARADVGPAPSGARRRRSRPDRAPRPDGRARSRGRSGVRAVQLSGEVEAASPFPTATADSLTANTVLLLDTMGELAKFYGLASVAFVGGSLVPQGGHDILQPLFHGVPTLFGPHMHNQRTLVGLVLGAGRRARWPTRQRWPRPCACCWGRERPAR